MENKYGIDVSLYFVFINMFRASYMNLEKEWNKVSKQKDLSYAQHECLWLLATQNGMTLTEIGNIAQWNKSTTSALISRLEDRGYLYKEKDENNLYRIYLTDVGNEIIHESLNNEVTKALESLFKDVPREEIIHSIKLLFSFYNRVTDKLPVNDDFINFFTDYAKKIIADDQ